MHFNPVFRIGGPIAIVEIFTAVTSKNRILIIDKTTDMVIRHLQSVRFSKTGRNNVGPVLRVQITQFFNRKIQLGRNLLEMQSIVHHNTVTHRRQGWFYRENAMFFIISEYIIRSDKSGHISPGLSRQMIVYIPIILFSSGTTNRFIDIPRPTVISSYHQNPVFINSIQIVQIANCRLSCFYRITAFVDIGIDFKLIHFPCAVHELPQSTGPRPG